MPKDVPITEHTLLALPESLAPGLEIICARALGDHEDVKDAVQESLARAVSAIQQQRVPAGVSLAAFVYGIARHIIADTLRQRSKERRANVDVERLRSSEPSPLETLVMEEERARIRRGLSTLPAADRELLRMCFADGERLSDIARRLGEPAERLRKRKSRALARLRAAVEAQSPSHV
ncbi:MAG: sigma-70 family RNA polymerase sigma factor [Gemmatimonadota bacterium]|nr:MAG: sigma-70 family RNA polymerase sigma factor [Gemmatimonadota bacterium]